MWAIGCITLAAYYSWPMPAWLPRASALIPGLLCFLFGIAMLMVSFQIPHLKASLSNAAVLAGIIGVSLSMCGWFLVSWNHPEKGLIPPDLFIPIAEETGQIIALGQWIIEPTILSWWSWQKEWRHTSSSNCWLR